MTLNVEVDVLRFLPFLSRIPLLNAARARVGYFLFVAGQISRPTDTILWQGQPLAPAVATDRTTWNMDGFSAGLVWED